MALARLESRRPLIPRFSVDLLGHLIAMSCKLATDVEVNLHNFIDQLPNTPNLLKNCFKQLTLDFGFHSGRTIDAEQAGMEKNVRKLSAGLRCISRSPRVDTIPSNNVQSPATIKILSSQSFQPAFPIQTT